MAKIVFEGMVPMPNDQLLEQVAHCKRRGLPSIRWTEPHGRTLAVVGGGPSIVTKLDEIRQFSDVWAVNGACGFLRENGIDATLLSLDPFELLAERVAGAKRAMLATRCHPRVFDVLEGAEIEVFDATTDTSEGIWASCSSITASFHLGVTMGFRKFVFFGCEGSFEERTHAYMDEDVSQQYKFVVEAGGKFYLTSPDLYMVTQQMAWFFKKSINGAFTERCGGLLRALIENDDHDIVRVSPDLMAALKPLPCPSCGRLDGHYDDCEVGMGVI